MEAEKFIGAWRLISAEFQAEDGSLAVSPYGPEPQGLLMYDAHGSMSAQLAPNNRIPFAIPDRKAGSDTEVRIAFETYQAYCGSYRIDEREKVITHTVTLALLPNWVGTEQRRFYEFTNGGLILRTPPMTIGGKAVTGELVWERVESSG